MRELWNYATNISALQKFVDAICRHRLTQAVFVEPEPLWQMSWRRHRTDPDFEDSIARAADGRLGREAVVHSAANDPFGAEHALLMDPEFDYEWYPSPLRELVGVEYPLLVRVHLCPRDMPESQVAATRRDIIGIARQYVRYFKIALEMRPPAQLALSSGDRIHGAGAGTLGGFLRDGQSNALYGVTCSHVANFGRVVDARHRHAATVARASTLNPSPASQLCRPHASSMNTIDAAILSTLSGAVSNQWGGPSAKFGSGQRAQMRGASSGGPHSYYVGGVGVVQTLSHNGTDYCFEKLFSIRTRPTAPLPLAAALALAPAPAQGDSGAWISVQGQLRTEWIGMLVGVDLVEGFAVEASEVVNWANQQTNGALTVW